MKPQQINDDDNEPMTKGAFREFCALVCEGLDPAKTGAVVQPHEPMTLASTDHDTEGKVVRMFDLASGRTAMQVGDGALTIID